MNINSVFAGIVTAIHETTPEEVASMVEKEIITEIAAFMADCLDTMAQQ